MRPLCFLRAECSLAKKRTPKSTSMLLDEHLERPLQGKRRALELGGSAVFDPEELEVSH